MVRAALAAALCASAPLAAQTQPASPPAVVPDPAELAEARAVIEIMYPVAEHDRIFDALVVNLHDQVRASMPVDALQDDGLKAIVDESLAGMAARQMPILRKHTPALLEAMAVAYANEFTLAELKDIRAFAETPSGGRYLSRAAYIVSDPAIAQVNSAMMTESFAFADTVRAELQQKLIAYLTDHPEVAQRLFGGAVQP